MIKKLAGGVGILVLLFSLTLPVIDYSEFQDVGSLNQLSDMPLPIDRPVNLNGYQIENVGSPDSKYDAVNKQYVDENIYYGGSGSDSQTLSSNSTNIDDFIAISNGNNITIDDDYKDADSNPNNEIQNLSEVLTESSTVTQDIDVNGYDLNNFFGSACGTGKVVQDVYDNGTFTCVNNTEVQDNQSLSIDSTSQNDVISLTNGGQVTIQDDYEQDTTVADDQQLSVDSTSTDDQITIDNGNTVSINDDYEPDTTNPDDQDLSSSRSGDSVTVDIDNGSSTSFTDNYEADTSYPVDMYVGKLQITGQSSISVSDVPFQPNRVTFTAQAPVSSYNSDGTGTGNGDTADNFMGTMDGFAKDTSSGISQQVIASGGSGNSINTVSFYSSDSEVIGIRYGDQNANDIGSTRYSLSSFDSNGFTLSKNEFQGRNLIVIYKAYRDTP